jgi:hypothetical protein
MSDMTKLPVLLRLAGMDDVRVRREHFPGADGEALAMDVYGDGPRTVILVAGYRDEGFAAHAGCRFMEMTAVTSWARLLAVSGLTAVTYTNHDPAADLASLATLLGDRDLALLATSGNVPNALQLLLRDAPARVSRAALCYGFLLDLDGHTGVAAAQQTFRFATPCGGKSLDDLRDDVPLFLARAGQEQFPGLNDALDRFVAGAVARNFPLTLVNHPSGPHAFDLYDDSETTREIVRQVLAFLSAGIRGSAGRTSPLPRG